jgi:hypothetical protein
MSFLATGGSTNVKNTKPNTASAKPEIEGSKKTIDPNIIPILILEPLNDSFSLKKLDLLLSHYLDK